jgi:hypothetical protein
MERINERQHEMNNGAATRTGKEYLKVGSRCRLSARGLKNMPRQTQHA